MFHRLMTALKHNGERWRPVNLPLKGYIQHQGIGFLLYPDCLYQMRNPMAHKTHSEKYDLLQEESSRVSDQLCGFLIPPLVDAIMRRVRGETKCISRKTFTSHPTT